MRGSEMHDQSVLERRQREATTPEDSSFFLCSLEKKRASSGGT